MFKTVQRSCHARAYARLLPRKARPDMAIERDNTAERVARIDKLMTEMKPAPLEKPSTSHTPEQTVTLTQGLALTVSRRHRA